jgi:hypothetical protein
MKDQPRSTFFAAREPLDVSSRNSHAPAELGNDPFAAAPHTAAMQDAGIIHAPLVVLWNYKVADARIFAGWLSTKDILLKPARLAKDPRLSGVKYGGTYHVATADNANGAHFRTHWGYDGEDAMHAMHALCSGDYERATIAQIDLMEFVQGVRRFVEAAGDENFEQEVLVASSASGDA